MGKKFDINLEQAMELLSLETDFTEKEFKTNYRKLIMSIHPDALGDINPIARKILEEEAKRTNIAKGIIESFLATQLVRFSSNLCKGSDPCQKMEQFLLLFTAFAKTFHHYYLRIFYVPIIFVFGVI